MNLHTPASPSLRPIILRRGAAGKGARKEPGIRRCGSLRPVVKQAAAPWGADLTLVATNAMVATRTGQNTWTNFTNRAAWRLDATCRPQRGARTVDRAAAGGARRQPRGRLPARLARGRRRRRGQRRRFPGRRERGHPTGRDRAPPRTAPNAVRTSESVGAQLRGQLRPDRRAAPAVDRTARRTGGAAARRSTRTRHLAARPLRLSVLVRQRRRRAGATRVRQLPARALGLAREGRAAVRTARDDADRPGRRSGVAPRDGRDAGLQSRTAVGRPVVVQDRLRAGVRGARLCPSAGNDRDRRGPVQALGTRLRRAAARAALGGTGACRLRHARRTRGGRQHDRAAEPQAVAATLAFLDWATEHTARHR